MGVKRVDKRSMEELRVEVGGGSFKKKLVRNRLKWAGHMAKWEIKNWQRDQIPRKWREKEARKTEYAAGKSGRRAKEGSWRALRENVGRDR